MREWLHIPFSPQDSVVRVNLYIAATTPDPEGRDPHQQVITHVGEVVEKKNPHSLLVGL